MTVLQRTFWIVLISNFVLITIVGAVVAAYLYSKTRQTSTAAITIAAYLVAAGLVGYWQASNAIEGDWEAAREEQATFRQKLHGFITDYGEDTHTCQVSSSPFGTNCAYYSERCYETRDGDIQCEYLPWFSYERTVWAQANVRQNGTIPFSDRLAPRNWEREAAYLPGGAQPGVDFSYEDPQLWLDVVDRVDAGEPIPATVNVYYLNYALASERTILKDRDNDVNNYEGILPKITDLYDIYKYDFLQIAPALEEQMAPEEIVNWVETSELWGASTALELDVSPMVYLVPAESVDNPDEWIDSAKTYMLDTESFGEDILPANLLLVGCGVNTESQTIEWCRLEQGLFTGNNAVMGEVAALNDMPFEPEAIFGNVEAAFTDGDDLREVSVTNDGSGVLALLNDPERGFERIDMESIKYLFSSIEPTPRQVWQIIGQRFVATLTGLLFIHIALISFTRRRLIMQRVRQFGFLNR